MDDFRENEFKLVVLGSGGVGKSALTIRLVNNKFLEEYDPTIEDSYRKEVTVDGENVVLDILDTAGQDEFSALQDQWMREGKGFLLVYSIVSRVSFEEMDKLRKKLLRIKDDDPNIPLVVCGNKCDLEDQRQVPTSEGREKAEEWNASFFETSAKEQIQNEECFFECVRLIKSAERKKQEPKPVPKKKGCIILWEEKEDTRKKTRHKKN